MHLLLRSVEFELVIGNIEYMFVEYTHKDQRSLAGLLKMVEKRGFLKVSLTNKFKDDDHLGILNKIRELDKTLQFVSTYSFKVRYCGEFQKTFWDCLEYLQKCMVAGVEEVLLVSGNPKRKLDTVEFLTRLYEVNRNIIKGDNLEQKEVGEFQESLSTGLEFGLAGDLNSLKLPKLGVAFNPFLEGKDWLVEETRLRQKLETGLVSTVYFQLGDDLKKLGEGLELVSGFRKERKCQQIVVSVLNPSKQILENLKFRPWHGVRYSTEFLSSVEKAKEVNDRIVGLTNQFDRVEVLWGGW
jgi:hypothetical protein